MEHLQRLVQLISLFPFEHAPFVSTFIRCCSNYYVSLISNDFLDGFVTCGIIGGTDPLSYEIGVSLW